MSSSQELIRLLHANDGSAEAAIAEVASWCNGLLASLDGTTRADDELIDESVRLYHLHPEVIDRFSIGTWAAGDGEPSPALAQNIAAYIDNLTGYVWTRRAYTNTFTRGINIIGPQGADGAPGAPGAPGIGLPTGGDTGQVLVKMSGDDYDFTWGNPVTGNVQESQIVFGNDNNGVVGSDSLVWNDVIKEMTAYGNIVSNGGFVPTSVQIPSVAIGGGMVYAAMNDASSSAARLVNVHADGDGLYVAAGGNAGSFAAIFQNRIGTALFYIRADGTTSQYGVIPSSVGSGEVVMGGGQVWARNSMRLTPTTAPTQHEGQWYWDDTDHTLVLQSEIAGSSLSVGQENWVRIVNKTGSTLTDGSVVYINGAQGNRPTAALAKADADATAQRTIGVVTTNISDNAEGYVTTFGIVRGFNTSGFAAGDELYLSSATAGALTNVAPTSGGVCLVRVGYALNSTNNGSIFVCPDILLHHAFTHASDGHDPITALGAVTFTGAAPTSVVVGGVAIGGGDIWADGIVTVGGGLVRASEIRGSEGLGTPGDGCRLGLSTSIQFMDQLGTTVGGYYTSLGSWEFGGTASLNGPMAGYVSLGDGMGWFMKSLSYVGSDSTLNVLSNGTDNAEIKMTEPGGDISRITAIDDGIQLSSANIFLSMTTSAGFYFSAGTDLDLFSDQDARLGAGVLRLGAGLVLPKASGTGIKVDVAGPTFPWRDIIGDITARGTGPTDPSWATYRGNIKQYQFTVNDEVWVVFHIPHDYVPGSELFIHAHWSHISAAVTSGAATWGFDISYAKGHNQGAFPATSNFTVAQNASTTQYQHMIAEVQITSSGQIGGVDVEVDGLILVRVYLSANTINGTPEPFLHTSDIHYQSTNIGTKAKAPSFYT